MSALAQDVLVGLLSVRTATVSGIAWPAGMAMPVRLITYSCTSSGVAGVPGAPRLLSLYCTGKEGKVKG